jgi:2,4-dienoyl-CoA reductase-like NADH-dependent reductase (Old Yellow Enzyme family)
MKIFTPIKINDMWIKNRIMMAPFLTNDALEDGSIQDSQIDYYVERAEGGVGLIMVEGTYVTESRKFSPKCLGIDSDSHIKGLEKLVKKLQPYGAKVAIQIGENLRAQDQKPSVLTVKEIEEVIGRFANAAKRVKEAGFDSVEFHVGHHYTLADFVSRRTNTRDDEYGRTFEGRTKILKEIIERSKEKVGKDYTMMCRINGDEFIVGGNTLKHQQKLAKQLEELGIHALDITCNGRWDDGVDAYAAKRSCPTREWPDAVNMYLAEGIKEAVRIPVIGGGIVSNPETAEKALEQNKCDMVYLGRPLFRDPFWPNKAREGKWDEILGCDFDNYCLQTLRNNERTECKYRAKKKGQT